MEARRKPCYGRAMRRFGDPIRPGIRYTRRPGAYGVILRGREALLVLTDSPGEEIALPGGGIDPGESPVQALHREALEETGWRIRVERRIGAYQRYTWMPEYSLWAHKVCHIYLCVPVRRVAAPTEPDHEPLWMDAAAAGGLISQEGDRHMFLRAVLYGR